MDEDSTPEKDGATSVVALIAAVALLSARATPDSGLTLPPRR
jgi:hypothetical protein